MDANAQQSQANATQMSANGTVDSRDYPTLAVAMKWSGAAEQKSQSMFFSRNSLKKSFNLL